MMRGLGEDGRALSMKACPDEVQMRGMGVAAGIRSGLRRVERSWVSDLKCGALLAAGVPSAAG